MAPIAAACTRALLAVPVFGRPLAYPEGVKPGDQISSTSGEFFRYTSVLVKPPDDEDRMESLEMAKDVKCEVCELITKRLLEKVESNSEDHIMDQFDGIPDFIPPSDNEQQNRVNQFKKGCNKHFKDEMLAYGHHIRRCEDQSTVTVRDVTDDEEVPPAEPSEPKTWCLKRTTDREISERDLTTYSKFHEGIFYACEHTVGKYGMEMATALAERFEEGLGKTSLDAAIAKTCREAAFCAGAKPRGRKAKPEPTKKKEPQAKKKEPEAPKKPEKKPEPEKSWMEMMEEDEDVQTKRRRRKKKPHTEL